MIPVRVRIGDTTWRTALFPKDGGYLLPIRDSARRAEGLQVGDGVQVHLTVLDGIPWDREARPSLEEVLTVRHARQATVGQVMESLTDEQLAAEVTRTEPGWPQAENFPIKECLRIVLNEEWEHRLYAERDLSSLQNEP